MKVAIVLKVGAVRVSDGKLALSKDVTVVEAPKKEADNLDFFYKEIGCSLIEGVYYDDCDYFIDEEGLFKTDNPVFSHRKEKTMLAGNIVVTAGCDNIGRTLWFDTDKDEDLIKTIERELNECKFIGLVR